LSEKLYPIFSKFSISIKGAFKDKSFLVQYVIIKIAEDGQGMITSTANAKVKRLVSLQKKRKLRDEEQVFLVEGIRMFQEVPAEQLQEAWVSESFYKKERRRVEEITARAGIRYELLSDSVYAHVSDTKTPQGVLGVVGRKSYKIEEMLEEKNPFLLVLDNLQDPGNLGTIVRTAEGAGVNGIILSGDSVDIYNPKTIRSTMGSLYRMPFCYEEDIVQAVERLNEAGITTYAAHLAGCCAYEEDYRKPCAFLIGNEGNGLRDKVAEKAQKYIRIPMKGKVESLNAAVAATVLMFEAARQRQ